MGKKQDVPVVKHYAMKARWGLQGKFHTLINLGNRFR